MKKLIILLCTVLLTGSSFSQNVKKHSGFYSKLSKQTELTFPGFNNSFINFSSQNKSVKQQALLKQANGLKQRLDSVVAPGFDKDVYMYDAGGNVVRDIYFVWDGQWTYTWKEDYAYDSFGNLTQIIENEWDGTQWVYVWKNEISYDANSNQLKNVNYNWNGDLWINASKEESAYDSFGNQTQSISYSGSDSPDDVWSEISKNEFVYAENGNLTEIVDFQWDGIQWNKTMKTENTFDAFGNMILNSISYWDGENWINAEKYETVYDENENITQFVYSEWNSMEWVEAAKYEYHYDAGGNMVLSDLIYLFENQEIIFMRQESAYDGYGNRIYYVFLSIDGESEDFTLLPILKQEYVYDNSYAFEDLILPFAASDFEDDYDNDFEGDVGQLDLNLLFKHKLTNLVNNEHNGDNWFSIGDYTLFYSEQTLTGVNDLKSENDVSVYPNPATNMVTFNVDAFVGQLTVELYDIQGKLVMSKISENNRPVSIEALNEGLYFYRLLENQNFYTGKIMVK